MVKEKRIIHTTKVRVAKGEKELVKRGLIGYLDAYERFRVGLPDNTLGLLIMRVHKKGKFVSVYPTNGADELFTRHYDASRTYIPNDYLTAWDSQLTGFSSKLKGVLTVGRPHHNTIVGLVSQVPSKEDNRLGFWPYHLPVDFGVPYVDSGVEMYEVEEHVAQETDKLRKYISTLSQKLFAERRGQKLLERAVLAAKHPRKVARILARLRER